MRKVYLIFLALFINNLCAQTGQTNLVIQRGHTNLTKKITMLGNGRYMVTTDGISIVVWDIKLRKQYSYATPANGSPISDFTVTGDGKMIIMGVEKSILFYDYVNDRIVKTIQCNDNIVALAMNPANSSLAIKYNMSLEVKDTSDKSSNPLQNRLLFSGNGFEYSPDGKYLFNTADNSLDIINKDGTIYKTYTFDNDIKGIAFSKDNTTWAVLLALSFDPGVVQIFRFDKKNKIAQFTTGKSASSIAFGPNNELLVSQERLATVLDNKSFKKKIDFPIDDYTQAAAITTDGKYYVIARLDGGNTNKSCVTDFFNGEGKWVFSLNPLTSRIVACASNPSRPELMMADWGGDINVFELNTAKIAMHERGTGNPLSTPSKVSYSKNGKLLSIGRQYNDICEMWRTSDWSNFRTYKLGGIDAHSVDFLPDEKSIIAGGGFNSRSSLFRFNLDSLSPEWILKDLESQINMVSVQPSGEVFAAIDAEGKLKIWNTKNHKLVSEPLKLERNGDNCLFSRDGKFLAVSSSSQAKVDILSGASYQQITQLGKDSYVRGICFDPSSQFFAIAQYLNGISEVKVYSTSNWQNIASFTGHNSTINALSFTSDGQKLFTVSDDGTAKLWNWQRGEELATFIGIGGDDYIIVTPDNYYMGSKGALKGIGFKSYGKLFPFDQFDLRYNRPDIVLQRLGYADPKLVQLYHSAYLKRLAKNGFTEQQVNGDFHVPELTILNKEIPLSVKNKLFMLSIKASDTQYKIDRLLVYVNDVPLWGIKGFDLKGQSVQEFTKDIPLELGVGNNKIQVSVMNEKGTESFRELINISYENELIKPDLYFVSIGVSNFLQSDYNLTYAGKDANDIMTLYSNQSELFNQIHVFSFIDKDATKANILNVKQELRKSKVDDDVIIFVASHGLLDSKLDYYIATHDIDFENPSANGLSYDDFESIFDDIPARHKLVLIDACHSGEVDKDEKLVEIANSNQQPDKANDVKSRGFKSYANSSVGLASSFELMKEMFTELRKGTGAIVVSSASGKEFAFESSEWKNGLFTYAFMKGLKDKEADLNHDYQISISELRDYVTKKVQELSQGKQNPTSRTENLEFDFRVW